MKPLAAVIVETRTIPNLVEIIRNHHMRFLPEGTQLILFHSDENYEILKQAFPEAGFSNINALRSLADYNEVFTRPKFWEQLAGFGKVLIFQTDSMLLRTGIEEFLEQDIDYVGAPWNWDPEYIGGNGGLSLRNPRVMHELCSRFKWNGTLNEDHWFCLMMKQYGVGRVAPREVADKFSCETIFKLGTFGCHGIEKWLSPDECNQITSQYTS